MAASSGWNWKTGSEDKRQRMAAYVDWLCTDPDQRGEVDSKAKLAAYLDVTDQTLRNYTRDPWFIQEVQRRQRADARVDRLPHVLDTLFTIASDPTHRSSVQAAKVYLDWVERVTDEKVEKVDVASLSSDELVKLALQVLEASDHATASR